MKESCRSCKFFFPVGLECHRYPIVRGEGWPQMKTGETPDDWCGEYRAGKNHLSELEEQEENE